MPSVRIVYSGNSGTSATFNVPTGVTSITVRCIGGGGAGGAASAIAGGGGGKGGGAAFSTLAVNPGDSHVVNLAQDAVDAAGSNTTFRNAANTADLVRAAGGNQGGDASGLSGGTGATGHVTTHLGDSTFNGGNGANGAALSGGGGGGRAGDAAGGNASGTTGGNGDFFDGSIGGGDGGDQNTNGQQTGGAGGGQATTLSAQGQGRFGQAVVTFDNGQDSVTPSDSATIVAEFFKSLTDSATATDDADLTVGFFRDFADNVTALDAIAKAIGVPASDIATASDGSFIAVGKFPTDSVMSLDQATILMTFIRTVDDTIITSDTIAKAITLLIEDDLGSQSSTIRKFFPVFDEF